MTHRTAILSTFDALLNSCDDYPEERADHQSERQEHLGRFSYAVMLKLAFPELDFANRWCWQNFGPYHGQCFQKDSEYPMCAIESPHCHIGTWSNHWYVKTDYNFGFNEWYFSTRSDRDLFLECVPAINWGESYPK